MKPCTDIGMIGLIAGASFVVFCAIVGAGVIGAVIFLASIGVLP